MSRIHSNVGFRSWGESCVVSANEVQLYTGAQLSFGDLTLYLTYNIGQCLGSRSGSGTGSGSACFFGPPGSGYISQRYGSGSGSFPFSHICVERTQIMPAK
jgi:hypothetical protein